MLTSHIERENIQEFTRREIIISMTTIPQHWHQHWLELSFQQNKIIVENLSFDKAVLISSRQLLISAFKMPNKIIWKNKNNNIYIFIIFYWPFFTCFIINIDCVPHKLESSLTALSKIFIFTSIWLLLQAIKMENSQKI